MPPTREGWKQIASGLRAAFPDMRLQIEAEIAEGDLVATRFTARGMQRGEFAGIPATGKKVTLSGIHLARVVDGRIQERWEELDRMGLMI